ncbi:hypothetical protein ACRAWF_09740 [Streptomyces sp. L7]
MHRALRTAGIPVDLHVFEAAPHGPDAPGHPGGRPTPPGNPSLHRGQLPCAEAVTTGRSLGGIGRR